MSPINAKKNDSRQEGGQMSADSRTLRTVNLGIMLANAFLLAGGAYKLENSLPYLYNLWDVWSAVSGKEQLLAAGMLLRPPVALLCLCSAYTGRLTAAAGIASAIMIFRGMIVYIMFAVSEYRLTWTWIDVTLLCIECVNFCWFCLFNIRRLYKSS
jgi:hypothetical protein